MVAVEQILIRRTFDIIDRQVYQDGWERVVTGVVADPINVDSYGNTIDTEEIRQAAWRFMEHFQAIGVDHDKDEDGNQIVLSEEFKILESWITREDGYINDKFVPAGAWVLTVRVVSNEMWEGVLSGEYRGFSFEALCDRIPLDMAA